MDKMEMVCRDFNAVLPIDKLEKIYEYERKRKMEDKSFKEVPTGTYIVEILSMQMGTAKSSGNDMMKVVFNVTDEDSEYLNSKIYMNQVTSSRYGQLCCEMFAKSLGTNEPVKYENAKQFNEILGKIFEQIKGKCEYDLQIIPSSSGYRNFKIVGIYDL